VGGEAGFQPVFVICTNVSDVDLRREAVFVLRWRDALRMLFDAMLGRPTSPTRQCARELAERFQTRPFWPPALFGMTLRREHPIGFCRHGAQLLVSPIRKRRF
jgi:hypothetical protein